MATKILERDPPVAKQNSPPEDEPAGAEEQTTAKLYRSDTRDLKQLAALMDVTMADAYRAVCAKVVSAALAAAARRRASEAERDAKG